VHVLEIIEAFLRLNGKRTQLRAARVHLASDGAMLNLLSVLLKVCVCVCVCVCQIFSPTRSCVCLQLCEPFSDCRKPAFDKITAEYLAMPGSRVDTSHETTLALCTADELAQWARGLPTSAPNFITEAFFLTLSALHIGLMPAIAKYTNEWVGSHSRFVLFLLFSAVQLMHRRLVLCI
jgi:hypothetical protein